jgi:hypothetical protein
MHQVPPEYVGLWRRDRIVHPDGTRDVTTEVYWLQSHGLYVDLRIPQPRPDFRGYRRVEDLPPELLAWLQHQEGFAGTLAVNDSICRWQRDLDYQPPGEFEDIWQARFINGALMIETGVLVEYDEVWRKSVLNRDAGVLAMRVRKHEGNREGVLVAVGDYFMYAIDRAHPLPLQAAGEVSTRTWNLAHFDCEIGFGRIRGASSPWLIERCSLPFREGECLLEPSAATPVSGEYWTPPAGCVLEKAGAQWTVMECTPEFTGFNGDG